jgi:HK97 family phage major capsid protein
MATELKDLKDVSSFLEEKLQLVAGKFDEKRAEDKTGFDQKVNEAMNGLKAEYQKELDTAMIELQAKLAKSEKPKRPLSFSEAFKKSIADQKDEVIGAMKGARSGQRSSIEMKAFDYSDFTGYEDFTTDFNTSIIANKYDSFNYRDVLPMGRMSTEFVKYPKEIATVGGAGVWVQSDGAKPEIEPKMEVYTAEAEWIAGLIKEIPVAMMDDLSFMASFLAQKGRNELLKAENLALQNGSGGISGILQEAVTYDGSKTIFVEKLIDSAMRQIKNQHLSANAMVLANSNYTDILLNKAVGSGEYDLPSVVGIRPDGTLTIAGIPVYSTTYIADNQAIIGDWREAQMLIRSNPVLRIFEQNADNAEKNLLLMRIEERVALAVYRQQAFVKLV